jgi:uncharacterized protein
VSTSRGVRSLHTNLLTIRTSEPCLVPHATESVEALYGPRLVHLLRYSSQARGAATAEADLDVLVVLQGAVAPGTAMACAGYLTASWSLQYNVVMSCAFVAEERCPSERSPFLLTLHLQARYAALPLERESMRYFLAPR